MSDETALCESCMERAHESVCDGCSKPLCDNCGLDCEGEVLCDDCAIAAAEEEEFSVILAPLLLTTRERLDDARQRLINTVQDLNYGGHAEDVAYAVELYVLWLIEYHHGKTQGLWRRDGTLPYMMGEEDD